MPDEEPPVLPDEPVPVGDPPPAGTVVSTGSLREETLAAELEAERAARKSAELRAADLEDQNHALRSVTPPAATVKRAFLEGSTFFH